MNRQKIEQRIDSYLQLISLHPHITDSPEGQLPIITDREQLLDEQQRLYQQADAKGRPREWYDLGIVAQDAWVVVLRDLVRFPNGSCGGYIRMLNRRSQVERSGKDVVILATVDGRFLLIRHFRHEDRQWHWECPRGFGEAGLTPQENAEKELREETALQIGQIRLLNTESEQIAYYHAECFGRYGTGDDLEAIDGCHWADRAEAERMLLDGSISDPYTTRAFLLYMLRSK